MIIRQPIISQLICGYYTKVSEQFILIVESLYPIKSDSEDLSNRIPDRGHSKLPLFLAILAKNSWPKHTH